MRTYCKKHHVWIYTEVCPYCQFEEATGNKVKRGVHDMNPKKYYKPVWVNPDRTHIECSMLTSKAEAWRYARAMKQESGFPVVVEYQLNKIHVKERGAE